MTMNPSVVVGVFRERDDAEPAIDELRRMGFGEDQIGFAMRGTDESVESTEPRVRSGDGAASGMFTGAGVGGLVAAAASLLIPGFGPVLAGGFLVTVLGGAAVGAAAGGLLGALGGLGVPEHEARYYAGEFQQGQILVTVRADGRSGEVRQVLLRHGTHDIEDPAGTAPVREEVTIERRTIRRPAAGGIRPGEEFRVPIHEERIRS